MRDLAVRLWRSVRAVLARVAASALVHPLLFAIFPILALYAANMDETAFSETMLPLAIAVVGVLVLLSMSLLACTLVPVLLNGVVRALGRPPRSYQSWDVHKAALIVSLFLLFFFSYGHVFEWVDGYYHGFRAGIIWLAFVFVFLFVSFLIILIRRSFGSVSKVLNVAAAVMVVVSLANIWIHQLKQQNPAVDTGTTIDNGGQQTGESPDIYYIILDGYPSVSTLTEFYGFDNADFLGYLADNGFYVAPESRSNYTDTAHSLASSLNMEYLNYLSASAGESSTTMRPLYKMVHNHKVWQFLETRGYSYIHIGSYWQVDWKNDHADVNLAASPIHEFHRLVLNTTMLRAPVVRDIFHISVGESELQAEYPPYQFKSLARVPDIKKELNSPVFVFAHVTIPHGPFVFDRDGTVLTEADIRSRSTTENLLNQLSYCNEQVKAIVDDILLKSDSDPIIIIQGDHGPGLWGMNPAALDARQRVETTTRILNAYHLPQGGNALVHDSITPVNTFRLIFDAYFQSDLGVLEDQTYISSYDRPYQFVSLEDTLAADASP